VRKVSALPDGGCGYEVTCERQPRGEVTNGMVWVWGERWLHLKEGFYPGFEARGFR
jgi:hypothetical protein